MNFFLILLSFGLLFSQFPKGYQLNTTNLGRFEMISKDGLSSNAIMSIRSFDEQLFFLGTAVLNPNFLILFFTDVSDFPTYLAISGIVNVS